MTENTYYNARAAYEAKYGVKLEKPLLPKQPNLAFPVALTVVIVLTLAALLVTVWYDGFKEGWRQANEVPAPAAGGGYIPPRASLLRQL